MDKITKQKKGLKRNTIDKFYTKPNVVKECVQIIKNNINILGDDLIIEPLGKTKFSLKLL